MSKKETVHLEKEQEETLDPGQDAAETQKTSGEKDLILRDTLAIDRTRLANQRTLLAFSRTGLYLIVTALAIFKFSETGRFDWAAWVLVGLGILVVLLGLTNFFIMHRKIKKAYRNQI